MVTYDELCTAIVKSKITSLGRERVIAAVHEAGLEVDVFGNVTKSNKAQLDKLMQEIQKISGKVGVIMARSIVRLMLKGQAMDLPESLK